MKKINEFQLCFWKVKKYSFFLIWLLSFAGCSTTQYLKEGESFYNGAKIKFQTNGHRVGRKKILEKEMLEYITPKPNGKFFGSRPAVWFYFKTKPPKKKKGLRNLLKNKIGKPPVLLTDVIPDRTAKKLNGYLYNEGYFKSDVNSSVVTKGKESTVVYTVDLERPFIVGKINYPEPKDSVYAMVVRALKEKSLLREGQRYQLGRLQAEQQRIETELKDKGFFYFDDRYLLFKADSTVGDRKVDLDLVVEPGMPQKARVIYWINDINIYPRYAFSNDTLTSLEADTLQQVGHFKFRQKLKNFRPEILTDLINLQPGEHYSREAQDLTLTHLLGLGTFKFVNIRFEPVQLDSSLLDVNIYLTPLKKKSIRAETQAVSKSNNFVGPGVSVTYTNRNFLKGAELFQVKLNTSYEVQFSRQSVRPLNSFEVGVETSLTVPRFILPIPLDFSLKRYLPKTQFKIAYNLQSRVGYFRLNSFNFGYGYNWRETAAKTHELFPIDITYVKTDQTSPEFRALILQNSLLAKSFENQFIVGSRYSYTLNTQLKEPQVDEYQRKKIKEHSFFFNGAVEVAGNLLHAVQMKVEKPQEDPFTLFGSPYSQYSRLELDLRYYWQPDAKNKIATRLAIGTGYAYGNSETMPYIKQFAIGGSTSIRAFPARSIGPGTYNARPVNAYRSRTLFIDQRGDIKLEGNIEYRFDIIKSLKGAVFTDAGNIWLRTDEPTRPGGKFDKNTFLNQLAVGTGAGMRYDFGFFVLRLDIAFPIRKPYLPKGEQWVFDEINFGSRTWRRNNLIFNIAIGYPF
jgi:outer membrane protein insertion porin family